MDGGVILRKQNNNKTHKWVKNLNRHFTKVDIWIENEHWKSYSALLFTMEMKVKTITRYHYMFTGEGSGNRLQYSCLGNPMDRV